MATANHISPLFDPESRNAVEGVMLELERTMDRLEIAAMAVDSLYDRERNVPLVPQEGAAAKFNALAATLRLIAGTVLTQINELECMPAMPQASRSALLDAMQRRGIVSLSE